MPVFGGIYMLEKPSSSKTVLMSYFEQNKPYNAGIKEGFVFQSENHERCVWIFRYIFFSETSFIYPHNKFVYLRYRKPVRKIGKFTQLPAN